MTTYQWYYQAKRRVESFLQGLDAELEVDVEETSVSRYDGGEEYKTYALVFSHTSNPNLHWTMEIEPNDEFIDHELEQVVKKIYFERVE